MRNGAFKAGGAQKFGQFGGQFGGQWGGGQGGGGGKGDGQGSGQGNGKTPAKDSVTYSEDAISELKYMIEEEKLAGDLYDAFYDLYGAAIFTNIAASEDKHFDALIGQAEKIGVDVDEFVFAPEGTYADSDMQELYDTLLEIGSQSVEDAINVGIMIETKDMADIAVAADAVEGTPLANIYDNLLAGSANHLDAFEAWLA